MSEAAETEYGRAPAGRRARVTDRVERRDPGAAHRRGLIQIESVGNAGQRFDGHGDRLGPAAGVRDSRDLALGTMGDVASSAPRAVTAASAEPSDGHPITDLPSCNI